MIDNVTRASAYVTQMTYALSRSLQVHFARPSAVRASLKNTAVNMLDGAQKSLLDTIFISFLAVKKTKYIRKKSLYFISIQKTFPIVIIPTTVHIS